jgi:hypothetical protein
MPKLVWTIACQRALVDQANNLSIVQVLEELGFPAPPDDRPAIGLLVPFTLFVVTQWHREDPHKPEKARARIRLSGPKGEQFASAEFDVDLSSHARARGIAELPGIVYHGAGAYVVRVDIAVGENRWRPVGKTGFSIHHNVPQPPIVVTPVISTRQRKRKRRKEGSLGE